VRGARKQISDGGSGAGALLFDLSRDPLEKSPADPEARGELAELLARYRSLRMPRGKPAAPGREDLEALQALGYLEDASVE